MKSISEIIALLESLAKSLAAEGVLPQLKIRIKFVPPTLHLDAVSDVFEGQDADIRLDHLQKLLDKCKVKN